MLMPHVRGNANATINAMCYCNILRQYVNEIYR